VGAAFFVLRGTVNWASVLHTGNDGPLCTCCQPELPKRTQGGPSRNKSRPKSATTRGAGGLMKGPRGHRC